MYAGTHTPLQLHCLNSTVNVLQSKSSHLNFKRNVNTSTHMGKANILPPCPQNLQKAHSDKEPGKWEAKLLNVHLKEKTLTASSLCGSACGRQTFQLCMVWGSCSGSSQTLSQAYLNQIASLQLKCHTRTRAAGGTNPRDQSKHMWFAPRSRVQVTSNIELGTILFQFG